MNNKKTVPSTNFEENLPPKAPFFVGRKQVFDNLDRFLLDKQLKETIVYAPSGFGKTSLLTEFSYLAKKRNKALIRWFHCGDSKAKFEEEYRRFALSLKINVNTLEIQSIIEQVNKKLSTYQTRILLIIDNIDSITSIQKYINKLPVDVKIILLTSNKKISTLINNQLFKKDIELCGLTRRESDNLLRNYISNKKNENMSLSRGQLLDSLLAKDNEETIAPFLLVAYGSFLNYNFLSSTSEIINELKLKSKNPYDGIQLFKIIEHLGDDEISFRFLEFVAFLNPEFIQLDIILQLMNVKKSTLTDVLTKLKHLNLIEIIHSNTIGIKIHRFFQIELKRFINQNPKTSINKLEIKKRLVSVINSIFPKLNENNEKYKIAEVSYYHAISLINNFSDLITDNIQIELEFAELNYKIGAYNYYKNSNLESAIYFTEISLKLRRKFLQPNDMNIINSLNSLGVCYENLGNIERSLNIYLEVNEILRKSVAPDKNAISQSQISLASIYAKLGDYSNAIRLYTEALKLKMENSKGKDSAEIANILNSIGVIHEKMGDIKQAYECHMKAYNLRLSHLPPENPDLSTSLNNIGVCCEKMGRLDEALDHFNNCLSLRKSIYKQDNLDIANCLINIGVVYDKKKNFKLALNYLLKAYDIMKKIMDPYHPDLAEIVNNIGIAYSKVGDSKNSIIYLEKALKIRKVYYGSTVNREIADSIMNLGISFGNLGDHKKSINMLNKAYELRKQLCSESFIRNMSLVETWSASSVRSWLENGNINENILKILDGIEGPGLIQLYFLCIDDTQQFFSVLFNLTNNKISLYDCGNFKALLETLFTKNFAT